MVNSKTAFAIKIALIIFGLFSSFILLEAGLRIGGYAVLSIQDRRNRQSIQHKGAYRIMCVGDSMTQSQYPEYLEEVLNKNNAGITFSVIDKGRVCTTSSATLTRLTFDLDRYHPDMVVAMIGANDQGKRFIYETSVNSRKSLFFRSSRMYRLAWLLWSQILEKINGRDLDAPKHEDNRIESIITEDSFKESISRNPHDLDAYIELGRWYQSRGKFSRAEETFKHAITLNPKNAHAYVSLGRYYWEGGRFIEAEDEFRKAISLSPGNDYAYNDLRRFYVSQKEGSGSEDSLLNAMEANFDENYIYAALSALYLETGKPRLADEYSKKSINRRLRCYNLVTFNNYRKLKAILDKRGIPLVCVQYPMRSIASLKQIFADSEEGIIFVDNERIFRDAVKQEGTRAYFKDMYAGDFGHCTEKGNRLLAGNIAKAIAKEILHK